MNVERHTTPLPQLTGDVAALTAPVMGVKPGYKQTAVGVIPEEWEVKPLADVVDFLDGRRRPVKDSDRAKMRGDIPYYGASGIVDYVNAFLFDEDLILLGEDGENILSRNCRLAFKISGKTWVNNHAHVLRPKPGMSLDYVAEFLESRDYVQYNTGTAQPKLNKSVCSKIPVLCPPAPEQRAIAGAMSDVDALLGGLDRLIAKKRDLKQAAMQQLLTGKTRLPGFKGEWAAKRLGDVVEITKGELITEKDALPGNIPVIAGGKKPSYFHSRPNRSGKTVTISGSGANAGYVAIYERPIFASDCSTICEGRDYSIEFIYFLLQIRQDEIYKAQTGGAQPHIHPSDLRPLMVDIPSVKEQIAIAAALSDMDAELAALTQRRDKTRALKQGMMQELLTGRTRLV